MIPVQVLIVEDEKRLAQALGQIMEEQKYSVDIVYDGEDGLDYALSGQYDVIVLDVMLPKKDGFTVVYELRKAKISSPVLMLTARDEINDKVTGLDCGADDYMTKPFRPLELVARVKSQLRRYKKYNPAQAEAEAGDVMTHAGLEMNVKAHQCLLDGKSLTLTPTEFSILQILLESKGTVVSAEELFYRIWADEYYSKTNNTITSHIRHLREKLNDTMDNPKYIRTIWGVGYKIED